MYVCRFCIRWTEAISVVDELTSLDVIKDVFGLELGCGPGFPRHVCEQCSLLLKHSVKFYEQLIDTEKSLWRFQEAGMLESLCRDRPESDELVNDTDSYNASEEIDDDELVQPRDGEVGTEQAQNEYVFRDGDEEPSRKTKEEVVDITIEAVEELEIVCAPWREEDGATYKQEDHSPSDNCEILDMNSSRQSDESEIPIDDETDEVFDEPTTTNTTVDLHIVAPKQKLQKTKNERISSKCFICDAVFSNVTELQTHLFEHEDRVPYHCEQCSTTEQAVVMRTIACLNKHLETHSYKFVCNQCPLRFRRYAARREHITAVHSGPHSHTCSLCGMQFGEQRNFSKHMNAHRNKALQRYKCATCAKVFQTSTLLKRHELIHAAEIPFKCPHCARGFNHEWNFKLHVRRHKQQDNVYACKQCSVEYANFLDWRRHMKEHFPEDPRYWELQDVLPESLRDGTNYPKGCAEPGCTYVAASLQLMWLHYRAHFKAFQCEHCTQKFASAPALRQHVDLVHRGMRPHECAKCGKRFGYRHKLVEHLKMHDGVRNLKCKYCEKRFIHTSNLTVHERIHTGARPYMCDLCGAQFRTSSAFAKHCKQQSSDKGTRVVSKSCLQQQLRLRRQLRHDAEQHSVQEGQSAALNVQLE